MPKVQIWDTTPALAVTMNFSELDNQPQGVLRQERQVDEDIVRHASQDLRRLFDQNPLVDIKQIGKGVIGDQADDVLEAFVEVFRVRAQFFIELDRFVEDQCPHNTRRQENNDRDHQKDEHRA